MRWLLNCVILYFIIVARISKKSMLWPSQLLPLANCQKYHHQYYEAKSCCHLWNLHRREVHSQGHPVFDQPGSTTISTTHLFLFLSHLIWFFTSLEDFQSFFFLLMQIFSKPPGFTIVKVLCECFDLFFIFKLFLTTKGFTSWLILSAFVPSDFLDIVFLWNDNS